MQAVFVDTPGQHKPKTLLGQRLNDSAHDSSSDVDVIAFVIDANTGISTGDQMIAQDLDASKTICVLNKTDLVPPEKIAKTLTKAAEWDFLAYFPVSALTGDGMDELVTELLNRLPDGPQLYPSETVGDLPDETWVAELVREQLLIMAEQELPHSIACRVSEWEWPRIRVEILVERDSQKGIVIGHGGEVLKKVGTAVRQQLPEGAFIELFVKVDKNWQTNPKALERLGY